jgi:hypothetical protein
MDDKTLFWLAGLFEGEAHFGRGTPSQPRHPRVALVMKDKDVIARVANLFDHSYTPENPRKDHWSTTYKFTLRGTPAAQLMKQIYPIMGERRRGQIDRALENYVYDPNANTTQAKITEAQVRAIKKRLATGETAKSIAQHFPISHYAIWDIRSGKTWGHVQLEDYTSSVIPSLPDFSIPNFTPENIFQWVVGLLEGEGSFMAGAPSEPNRLRISIAMTDEDVIARFAAFVNLKYSALASRSEQHKNVFRVTIRGAHAAEFMKQVQPHLGQRRQQQINEALATYLDIPHNRGMYNANAKISEGQAKAIKQRLQDGENLMTIAADYNISVSIVREIKLGRTWKHITI